jgi:hypothetical protein
MQNEEWVANPGRQNEESWNFFDTPVYRCVLRDSELTDIPSFTLRFRSDLSFLIEQNRRRSYGYAEDFAIEGAAKMA